MHTIDKLIMLNMAVDDMNTVRDFYADRFGLKVTADYEYGGKRWVSMALLGGGTSINLTTEHENMKPGTLKLYLSTPDIEAAHGQLKEDGASQISDDLYGPGSGVKWFSVDDPENNHWMIVQETNRDGHES